MANKLICFITTANYQALTKVSKESAHRTASKIFFFFHFIFAPGNISSNQLCVPTNRTNENNQQSRAHLEKKSDDSGRIRP